MKQLSDDIIVYILTYLRAVEFAAVAGVNKRLFTPSRIHLAIQRIMTESPITSLQSTSKKSLVKSLPDLLTPSALYVFEINSFLYALAFPNPLDCKGYWISTGWVSNAKKYFEGCQLPDLPVDNKKAGTKKQAKRRQRRAGDANPPSADINSDLLCAHGGLALAKSSNGKRRPIDTRCWKTLRKYFPYGPEYPCATSSECCICADLNIQAKEAANERKLMELQSRRTDFVTPALENVFHRKSGVPTQLVINKDLGGIEAYVDDSVQAEVISQLMQFTLEQPLLPGLYNVVTRSWLRNWRSYVKDPKQTTLEPLDCGSLFCHQHGHLVIPSHLEEYLVGLRKNLLSGLVGYEGIEVEIITSEEWDEFQNIVHRSYSDLCVRFLLDGDQIVWNCPTCSICDPRHYTPLRSKEKKGKNGTIDEFFCKVK